MWGLNRINNYEAYSLINEENIVLSDVNIGVLEHGVFREHEDLININESLSHEFYTYSDLDFMTKNQHGTAVSGVIAATRNNGLGIDGVSSNAKIVSLEHMVFYNTLNHGTYLNIGQIIEAISYAGQNGIKVLNFSISFNENNLNIRTAMNNYQGLIVCGSGNGYHCLDTNPVYPACYNLDNIITVGAIDYNNNIWSESSIGSNYSTTYVDVMAPGCNIYSLLPYEAVLGNPPLRYDYDSGTSYSTAYVTGLAAMMLSLEYSLGINFSAEKLKEIIMSTVTTVNGLDAYCSTGGYINCEEAINYVLENRNNASYYVSYNGNQHIVHTFFGYSYLENHDWIPVYDWNINSKKPPRPLYYYCSKCDATKIEL